MSDQAVEEDVIVLLSTTVASVAGVLCLHLYTRGHDQDVSEYREPLEIAIGIPFDLDLLSEAYCLAFFRFTHYDIHHMLRFFNLEEMNLRVKYTCTPETAMCLVLYRLSVPCRYKEIMYLFQKSRSWLSVVFNDTITYLLNRYLNRLDWDQQRLTPEAIRRYANVIQQTAGLGVGNIWVFIDGTMRAICRPTENQRLYYSGYKKCHSIKFQAATTPDGIISHFTGLWPGSRGDWSMYMESGLQQRLRELHIGQRAEDCCYLYGDPAYSLSYGVMSAYRALPHRSLNPVLQEVNALMSGFRVSVEHSFGKVLTLWGFNGYKSNLKIGLSPVAAYFTVSVLLANVHSCIYGNQTSQRFDCQPPTLEEYLG